MLRSACSVEELCLYYGGTDLLEEQKSNIDFREGGDNSHIDH